MNSTETKEKIVKYLREQAYTHVHVNSVDLVAYIELRVDIVLLALNELEREGTIERYWNGRYYEILLS